MNALTDMRGGHVSYGLWYGNGDYNCNGIADNISLFKILKHDSRLHRPEPLPVLKWTMDRWLCYRLVSSPCSISLREILLMG